MGRVFMSDEEYVRRVLAMEKRLYRVAQAMLWREADCLDAVQEAVFRGWTQKGRLRDEARFEHWLMRILVNQCREMLRRRKREPAGLPENVSETKDLCTDLHLRQALQNLPEKYRLPLVLHHVEGYAVAEVADMLDIPRKLTVSRLHQARKALRDLLDGGDRR